MDPSAYVRDIEEEYDSVVGDFREAGRALKALREAQGKTLGWVAARFDPPVAGSTISGFEVGNPTASSIASYLRALELDHWDLARAIDQSGELLGRPGQDEVREPSASDPLDEQTDALVDEFRKLVEMVKSRGKGS